MAKSETASSKLAEVIRNGVQETPHSSNPHPVWSRLRELQTELWLDTGDMEEAERLWSAEFSALTTNNTLLNKEIQKGIYDEWIPLAVAAAKQDQPNLDPADLILEVAFALNARHGLRLVQRFGVDVSVELHTNLAHDVDRSVDFGRRYHALCPDNFIVKVPLTAAGLVAARRLVEDGIRVNFTLGFSARQNALITSVARPDYVNVFMGRLNAYASDESLGDGKHVGERATLASQAAVRKFSQKLGVNTRQIGASMRSGEQAQRLAGLDVYTMPPPVAEDFFAQNAPPETVIDRTGEDYVPEWHDGIDPTAEGLEALWDVGPDFETVCLELAAMDVSKLTPDAILDALHGAGHGAVLPRLTDAQINVIADAGKMPLRSQWQDEISQGSVGLDALFTLAGLHAFAKDQEALDDRIRKLLD